MRALLAHWLACWEEMRARQRISLVEREQAYHRQLISFHAERANACHHDLIRMRREFSEYCLGAHCPSARQVDGSHQWPG